VRVPTTNFKAICSFIAVIWFAAVLPGMVAAQNSERPSHVKLTEVNWHGVGAYKIEMPMGTVYFEKDGGVSGFKSFVDNEGNDWIASYLPPGPNGDFRGFPNSVGNFGHAGRDSGSTTKIVNGVTEGDLVVLESTNGTFTFQYYFFADHISIKVLKSEGEYNFLFEGVAGGTADAEDYFVTADGKKHIPKGEFWDFTPEWFYLGDPKAKNLLFLAKTPDDDAPNENHRQIRPNGQHNMDLYSFGRTGREHGYTVQGMSGNEHVAVIGFVSADRTHNEIAAMIEGILADPFSPGVDPVTLWNSELLEREPAWYSTPDALAIANSVIQYQSPQGGWPKSTDLARPPLTERDVPAPGNGRANTIDNEATTEPMRFLARVIEATNREAYKASFNKGLEYLFAAQYPNGGWPQFWPLRGNEYYSRATFNDDAIVNVLTLLRSVSKGEGPYGFVSERYRQRAQKSVDLGIDFILKTQVRQNGRLTAWAAQYDENTLEPAWARAYEPPSLSGNESIGIIRFLMGIEKPSEEVVTAIESAVSWLKDVAIKDYKFFAVRNDDGRTERKLQPEKGAPLLWARFYELGTDRPLFLDRDSVYRYNYNEIGYERRSGYNYLGYWATDLLEKDYPQWLRRLGKGSEGISESGKAKLNAYLQGMVDDGKLPGGVLLVKKAGHPVYSKAFGWQDREAKIPMQEDSLFRIASQTKAITTAAAMILVDQGKLKLEDPLEQFIPEYKNLIVEGQDEGAEPKEKLRPITIRDLMTHTSGIPYTAPSGSKYEDLLPSWYLMDANEEICALAEKMAEIPLKSAPGEAFVYGYNTDILGCVIERVSGQRLDAFFSQNIFAPLGMEDTYFYVPDAAAAKLTVVYSLIDGKLLKAPNPGGHVNSKFSGQGRFREKDLKMLSGGAGLVSTAEDYTKFLQMLLDGGVQGEKRILSAKAVRQMTMENQLRGAAFENRPGMVFGLGFYIVNDVPAFAEPTSPGSYGWGGAFHSTYWVDPVEKMTVVYLTQVIPATGLRDNKVVRQFLYEALEY